MPGRAPDPTYSPPTSSDVPLSGLGYPQSLVHLHLAPQVRGNSPSTLLHSKRRSQQLEETPGHREAATWRSHGQESAGQSQDRLLPRLRLLPFIQQHRSGLWVHGRLPGGISNTDLSLKKPWKGIFPKGHKETAKGNYTRQGPPQSPCATVLSATPLQVLILSALCPSLSFPLPPSPLTSPPGPIPSS